MGKTSRRLVVLGCSAVKVEADSALPAVSLYDGPAYRVLRSYLRTHHWPGDLSLGILSAKYGLIGGISPISSYDQRMTPDRAAELRPTVMQTLTSFSHEHHRVDLILGKDYLQSVDRDSLVCRGGVHVAEGPIGMKLHRFHDILRECEGRTKKAVVVPEPRKRPLYFLPDWDDFLDADYDFENDRFSAPRGEGRRELHSISLMRPRKLSDGILVSLAQHLGSKGLLKRMEHGDPDALSPRPVRDHFRLLENQWAFGDCGAFSYVAEDSPTISVQQAVSLYDLYDFDLGASVDHIPVPEIPTAKGTRKLTKAERQDRVKLSRANAEAFFVHHRACGARFIPVGTIQGLDAKSYAAQIPEYAEIGYRYVALGGLVPRSDADVLDVVKHVADAVKRLARPMWIHLFGVYRPKLQEHFRQLGVDSFDSATYFRKAWLRSDQNYLAVDGSWYAAIRVPPTSDARTLARLQESGTTATDLAAMERKAMDALHAYDRGDVGVEDCLEAVLSYDKHLARAELLDKNLIEAYRRTLVDKPWKACSCAMCSQLGIDVLVFRGFNRNKRRGAHNTLQLFRRVAGEA